MLVCSASENNFVFIRNPTLHPALSFHGKSLNNTLAQFCEDFFRLWGYLNYTCSRDKEIRHHWSGYNLYKIYPLSQFSNFQFHNGSSISAEWHFLYISEEQTYMMVTATYCSLLYFVRQEFQFPFVYTSTRHHWKTHWKNFLIICVYHEVVAFS